MADVQNQKIIECRFCHNIKKDDDEQAHRFGSANEKQWYSIIDTTGNCNNRACHGQYCNPCNNTNFYNPGGKLMFCNPYCYLSFRQGVSEFTDMHKTAMLQWCDDCLGYNREQIKLRIINAFLPAKV